MVRFGDLRIWTRDDPPRLVPFDLNPVQAEYHADLCAAYGVDPGTPWLLRGARINTLKARQQGFSTYWLGLWYQMHYNLTYSQTVLITHRAESTAMLWGRIQLWEAQLRKQERRPLPALRYSNRRELVRADTGSSLLIATAGQDDLTRSGTITNVHATETAFWEDADARSIYTAMLGTLPAWANIVEESTAKGYGAHKARYEQQESDEAGRTGTRVYFFPFAATQEYRLDPPANFVRTEAEQHLTAVTNVGGVVRRELISDAQVYWRRRKAAQFAATGSPELVGQEFPLSAREAFLASATGAVYDVEYLEALDEEMRTPERQPLYTIEPRGAEGFGGTCQVWEEPVPGVEYCIPADVAEGHDEDDEHDFDAAGVYRCDTRVQVAGYWGKPAPEHFACDLSGMAAHYNGAIIVPERNAMGVEVINELHHLRARVYKHNFGDEKAPEHTRFGFPTTTSTKALRDGKLKSQIALAAKVWREGSGKYSPSEAALYVGCPVIRSRRAIRELIHYTNLPKRKRGGVGAHDDENTQVTIGNYYLEEWVPQNRKRLKPREPDAVYGGGRR